MSKATKIIATIGPATESEEVLTQLIQAGMNVARFNTKHSDPEWHDERVKRVRKVAKKLNAPVGILLDLQGPEIRIDLPDQTPFEVKAGEEVIFSVHKKDDIKPRTAFIPQDAVNSLKEGDSILLEDGACEFRIKANNGDHLIAVAIETCTVKHRKTMNTPGVVPAMPSLTDRDLAYLDKVSPDHVDFVGLSFVRNKKDIDHLRAEMAKRKYKADVVAKIENQLALDNLDEIIEASEVVMVARGDLGVEVPYQELTFWQRTIINKCRQAAKPVITATEMLKSMVEKSRPTRAEVSDVAHAIYDGTDAIMLSDETTIGKFPVKAVSIQAQISAFNEPHAEVRLETQPTTVGREAITQAAIRLLESSALSIDKIVCLTESGQTARLLSRFRPKTPIHVIVRDEETMHKLALSYGVTPSLVDGDVKDEDSFLQECKKRGIINAGENILLVRGKFWRKSGFTNTLSIITVE